VSKPKNTKQSLFEEFSTACEIVLNSPNIHELVLRRELLKKKTKALKDELKGMKESRLEDFKTKVEGLRETLWDRSMKDPTVKGNVGAVSSACNTLILYSGHLLRKIRKKKKKQEKKRKKAARKREGKRRKEEIIAERLNPHDKRQKPPRGRQDKGKRYEKIQLTIQKSLL